MMNVKRPCGVFDTNYGLDTAIIRTKAHWTLLILGVLSTFLIPYAFFSPHWLGWITETCIVIIAVLGLYFVTGLCGQISLGQAAFMAVGAYVTVILIDLTGMSFWLSLPIAAVTTGFVSVLFGFSSLRVKGFYLAMATLAAQFIILWMITHPPFSRWTGGFDGLTAYEPAIGPISFATPEALFFLVLISMWLVIFFTKNITRTRPGRAFIAIRDSDLAAEVLGINIFRYKILAFFLAGVLAGIAGGLFSAYSLRITPDNFHLDKSIWYLGMLIVGGSGSVVGAVCGVVFLRFLLEFTVIFGPYINAIPVIGPYIANYAGAIAFSLTIIIFLIFEPRGINHRWETFKNYYRLHPFSY